MKRSSAHERLIGAVRSAIMDRGPGLFGLSDLEMNYGGPAAGAAGSVVRKWPASGIVQGGVRMRRVKDDRRTVVRVEHESDYQRNEKRQDVASAIRIHYCTTIICVFCSGTGKDRVGQVLACSWCVGTGWAYALSTDLVSKLKPAAQNRVISDFKRFVQEVCPEHGTALLQGDDGANLCTICQAVD